MSEAEDWPSVPTGLDSSSVPSRELRSESAADDVSGVALVPCGGSFAGQVALQGRTRIDGAVRGSLRGSGELVLSRDARVEGIVECDVVSSSGVIIGPVAVRIGAYFADGARFDGDLDAPRLEIEGDVIWNGVARVGGG